MSRAEAEKWLLFPGNPSGTFLVRTSTTKAGLSLSVRDGEGIKHYRIRRLDNDGGYFIASRVVFASLQVSCFAEASYFSIMSKTDQY